MPELAVLKTVGFRNIHITGLVFAKAIIPCLAGALLGTLLAKQLAHWPAKFLPAELSGLPTPTVSAEVMLLAGLIALGVAWAFALAVVGGIVPAIRSARLPVAEALRQA